MNRILDWFGFGSATGGHGHVHEPGGGDGRGHGHTHGIVDPSIAATATGIWAVKWSFVILAATAIAQLIVVFVSGSVALLADTIHNIGDATTAIPLWIAFALGLRKPSRTFTYGLGRVEDLAGAAIVLIILVSALVAGTEAIDRLIHPHTVEALPWVALAGVIGFAGNEAVAVFRLRVGRAIESAALIADGYHARTDGLTSLAVVVGAAGVWLGFPLADPIIGLLITIAIFGIVWQSARAVFTRMLDGVEPSVIDEIRHAATHVEGIKELTSIRARWIGHRLTADLVVAVDASALVVTANHATQMLREELHAHLPALASVNIELVARDEAMATSHHHAPSPFRVASELADGILEIADTPEGERMVLRFGAHAEGLKAMVAIDRGDRLEELDLVPAAGNHHRLQSRDAPAEPHEFNAKLVLSAGGRRQELPFRMVEPADHHH